MRISKWGDEIAVTKVKAGEPALYVEKPARTHELLEKLREYQAYIPDDFKFNREEANQRGAWNVP